MNDKALKALFPSYRCSILTAATGGPAVLFYFSSMVEAESFHDVVTDYLEGRTHGKELESRDGWRPIETLGCEEVSVDLYSKEWVDPDFNPHGIREGFRSEGPGGPISSARWCPEHDQWETDEDSKPTHWRKRAAPPAEGEPE